GSTGDRTLIPSGCTADYCVPPEVPNHCPDSGTFAGYISAASAVGTSASLNGCSVTPNYVDVECKSDAYETFPDGSICRQIQGYQYTGDLSQSGDVEINPDDVTETDPLEPAGVRPSTSNTDIFQDSETLPDGTQVDTKTTTTTENRGSGHVAEETTTTKTHKFSNGITYTEVTIETTVTAPDGSKTVTTEINTTYTANPVTTVNITKPLGPVHETSSNPVSSSTTVTKTETYDSDGNQTGSSTTASGSGDGLGEDDGEGSEYCDENPDAPSCIEWAPEGEGGSFDMEGYDAEIAEAKQNLTDLITDIKAEISEQFYFDANGSSLSCVAFVNFNGMSKQFCLSDYANPLSKIAQAILLIALIIALVVILK
uniref:hypothetical protein n=1 Tax=Nitrincola sp. TaxID=1926584 RepID=UPI003A92C06A